MLRKSLSLALASLLIQVVCVVPVPAGQQADKETRRIAKVRERVVAISLVEKKRAIVTRRDRTKLRGRVSEIEEDSFVITDDETGASSTVAYGDVAGVKSKGDGLSTDTKVIIGTGVAAAAAFVTWGLIYRSRGRRTILVP